MKTLVYLPIGKFDDYLKYFEYVKDEEIEECGYLLKDVELDKNSNLLDEVIKGIETLYNMVDSGFQEGLESEGLKFEYRLNVDQTSSYYLVLDEFAKSYIRKAKLNIAVIDGSFEPLVLVTANGAIYGNADVVDSVDEEGKKFLQTLITNKLLKKKTIRVKPMDIPEEFEE